MKDKLDKVARDLEAHISVLVDYDLLTAQVGDTLTEYVWRIVQDNQEESDKMATVTKLGESNEVHILGPTGLKHNR